MNLRSQLTTLRNQSRDMTIAQRAEFCCRTARELEKAGEYEAAWEALSEFWPDRDSPPKLEGLDESLRAEVLLRVGALAGWLGSANQASGSQEMAKNLITKSIETFEGLNETEKAAGARTDLALCYWREGAFDEARIFLRQAIDELGDGSSEIGAIALIRRAIVEKTAARYTEALSIYKEAEPLVQATNDHALKGTFHNGLATLLNCRGLAEKRDDYIDQSLIEFAAASFHFEQAGHIRYLARVENNLGYLFFTIARFKDAYVHLDRARGLFLELGDIGAAAGVDETRARTLLAEARFQEAERYARFAVRTLEKGDEHALLAEALTTYGIVQARTGRYLQARTLLERAIEVAETAGDLEGAGRAKLSIIEELTEQTSATELASIFESAADLLQRSQDPSAGKRLISCARRVIDVLRTAEQDEDSQAKEQSWEGFSFKKEVLKIEKAIIARALRDAGGSVTKAARLLGFSHHQNLIALINSRHKDLLQTRSAVRKRRTHLFSKPRKIKRKVTKPRPERATSQISILHVEDDELIAKLVQEMFPAEEWRIELCSDGYGALEKLTGSDHYDLLLVDNDIPGLSGLELVQRARKITHRRRTPIVMLSGSNCETEAWGAGVQAFLRKPEHISELPSTITRLLEDEPNHT
jgi:two-component system chemotaxis response regulator CheY